VLFHWCEKHGLGPLGVTGLSMGGHVSPPLVDYLKNSRRDRPPIAVMSFINMHNFMAEEGLDGPAVSALGVWPRKLSNIGRSSDG
jgi:hypothetical protein